MILEDNKTIKMNKTYRKILYLYPSYNNTFCFLGIRGHRQDCVVHVNSSGKILYQHVFPKAMDSFGMLTQKQCIMLETRSNCITILNLETYQFKKTSHYFMLEQSDQSMIYTFADAKLLCVQQHGYYNKSCFKLSYYHYPPYQYSEPCNVFQGLENQWTHQYIIRKANNHSMVCWYKARHDNQFEFRAYDLRDPKGQYKIYKFANTIGVEYNIDKVQCAISNMWQMTGEVFMLVCITDKTQKGKDDVINNNYVYDAKINLLRQAKFSFGENQQYLIDQYYIGSIAMFRTFRYENEQALQCPIYYISNKSQEIIAQRSWKCTYLNKYQFPGYDGDMICETLYKNGDVSQFQAIPKKIMNPKQTAIYLAINMYQNFDDDFLQDVYNIIQFL